MMAIVKANYTRSRDGAKRTIRYIAHRPGRANSRASRPLWSIDGQIERQEAYQLIDSAGPGSTFFRFIVSPDPIAEDGPRDLHLRSVTGAVIDGLEERLGHQVAWVAALHDDHAYHRHVHAVVVVTGRIERGDLEVLTREATLACAQQRLERDSAVEVVQQREEEAEWDRELS